METENQFNSIIEKLEQLQKEYSSLVLSITEQIQINNHISILISKIEGDLKKALNNAEN